MLDAMISSLVDVLEEKGRLIPKNGKGASKRRFPVTLALKSKKVNAVL
jgi:hypothetical protein